MVERELLMAHEETHSVESSKLKKVLADQEVQSTETLVRAEQRNSVVKCAVDSTEWVFQCICTKKQYPMLNLIGAIIPLSPCAVSINYKSSWQLISASEGYRGGERTTG